MFETLTSVMLLIMFLVPGFVWRTVEGQFVYLDKRLEWEKFALGLLARSTVIHILFATVAYQAWQENWLESHPIRLTAIAIGFIGLLPRDFRPLERYSAAAKIFPAADGDGGIANV